MTNRRRIQVFEYDKLKIGSVYGDDKIKFEEKHFNALVKINELHKGKYFRVGYKNIQFKQYVGVIQIDGLTVEILPKADKDEHSKAQWQSALIGMLKATKKLKVNKVGHANVDKQSIHLLDIYFEWYLNELKLLLHQGLFRQYYRKKGNLNALKGKLVFADHISKNLVHKERFYTEHQIYDYDHLIHQVLGKALGIIEQLSKGNYLYSYCKTIQLDFPETKVIHVNESTFSRLPNTRITKPYKTALEIARLIILNFAPNITNGRENMLALLFDMNSLWEEYILIMLKRSCKEKAYTAFGQRSKPFWNSMTIRPDIVIQEKENTLFIIDTKWKKLDNSKPSIDDLRQMYAYNKYWNCHTSMLLYPIAKDIKSNEGVFWDGYRKDEPEEMLISKCTLGFISVLTMDGKLDNEIGEKLLQKLNL
jgi:5-methylcytosine-specific restriction enzyme subunit McrC